MNTRRDSLRVALPVFAFIRFIPSILSEESGISPSLKYGEFLDRIERMYRMDAKTDSQSILFVFAFILSILSILSKESGIFQFSSTGNFRQEGQENADSGGVESFLL